jgi:D-alanyl-D-alanine carboxypeptidase
MAAVTVRVSLSADRPMTARPAHRSVAIALIFLATACPAPAATADIPAPKPEATLAPALASRIDAAADEVLRRTGVPSASIAVVQDGRIAYVRAYGHARLGEAPVAAQPATRYAIGSISKQFTAAALLLLQEDGKLSLDDSVAKYLPELTRARDITIRQLLTHTAGYQDYWPHDYTYAPMLEPTTPEAIMERWAKRPLDYEPGTRWQYSNTGYVIVGRIVELVAGEPLHRFLQRRIFEPLRMTSVLDFDREPLAPGMATGYESYALGPPRESRMSGPGWLFGTAALAMTAEDLARWNLSLMKRGLLTDASYRALETEQLLLSGVGTDYGLGIGVARERQRRKLEHGGEVSGFTTENIVYPDDGIAIVVLTNQMATAAPAQLAERIARILLEQADTSDHARTEQARAIFVGLQQGKLDRTLFSAHANAYFSVQALADFAASLAPLGAPARFEHQRTWQRGGMTGRSYIAHFADRRLRVWTYELPDGKLEQYQVQVME